MRKNIYIIRHCKAEGQPSESQLTERGFMQANELADFLTNKKVDRIISSPFLRAIQSIEPFAKSANIKVEIDSRLSERVLSSRSYPNWLDKLKATFNDVELKYEGGESSKEAMYRIVKVVEDIVASDADNTIIVTHGNIMSLLLNYYDKSFGFEQWKGLSNPDVFLLQFIHNDFSIEHLWKRTF
jgi:2,3-bisphosphoglycerate-dependent phosphoglycerate mutase